MICHLEDDLRKSEPHIPLNKTGMYDVKPLNCLCFSNPNRVVYSWQTIAKDDGKYNKTTYQTAYVLFWTISSTAKIKFLLIIHFD